MNGCTVYTTYFSFSFHGDSIAAVHDKRVLTGDLQLNLTMVIYESIYKINDLNTGKIYNYIEKQHE